MNKVYDGIAKMMKLYSILAMNIRCGVRDRTTLIQASTIKYCLELMGIETEPFCNCKMKE